MLEIIFTAVLEVAKCLAVPIGRQCSYLCNYKSNFDNLERKVEELKAASDKVQRKVGEAISNVETIEEDVKDWQKKVDKTIVEAGNLIQDKPKNNCFKGLMSCYNYGKEASTKLELIAQLLQQEEKFGRVSHPTILPDTRLASSKDYYNFQSRISTSNNITNALCDASIHLIGVYGMPGVGKTTLVKKVGSQAKSDHSFDEMVFTEVTETPDIKRIQKEIAGKLRLKFENETESERASKLYARLEKAKKILIILDNVWEDLDLEKIGIPFGDNHVGCKLLLTTRDLHVLEKMGSKTNFPVGVLNEKEAWDLFVEMAGDVTKTPELKSLPNDVCKECGGLPIAIVTVAKALRNRSLLSQWKEALRQLKRPSPDNFKGDLKAAYSKIELSYDYLGGVELKKTFLLISLMRFGSIEDLFKYATGLSIFKDAYTMPELRHRVVTLIHELKASCLLLDDGNREWLSMHDFIRDVAISIAKRDENVLYFRNEIKWEWPDKEELKRCTKISVSDCTIDGLREGLKCPQLEFFFMTPKNGDSHVQIPEKFFMEMTELKVLDLTNMQLFSLPPSLQFLVNLQTLCLDFCTLEDIASIGELKELKVLSLISSNIKLLPIQIGQLTQLRLLDLRDCKQLKVILTKVISSLSRLEELYMRGSSVLWKDEGLNDETSNSSLEELKCLSELTTLEIDINDEKILPEGLFTEKLERFNISVGDGSSSFGGPFIPNDHGDTVIVESCNFDEYVNLRTLKLKLNFSTTWAEKLQGLNNVEFLCLDKLEGIKNVLYELDTKGFPELKHLHVHNNPNLLGIVASTKCAHHHTSIAFPLLESLVLFNLVNLEKICHDHPPTESFSNLKFIELQNCVKLKSIFSFPDISRSLPRLQRIRVENCENMTEIFAVEREDSVNNVSEDSGEVFSQLRFLTLRNLPRLASFYSKAQTTSKLQMRQKEFMTNNLQYSNDFNMEDEHHTLTPFHNKKVVFPNLEDMILSGIDFVEIWGVQHLAVMSSSYQNLTRLIVVGCKKLKYVFPYSIVKSFERLQYLEISHCRALKEVIAKGEGEEEAIAKFVFPRVTFLKLNNLPELISFYPGIHISEWPMLKKLEVCDCDKVKIFTSDYLSFHKNIESHHSEPQSIFLVDKINSNVEELTLSRMDNKMIWQGLYPENLFGKFKVLELYNDESANIPLAILQQFNNLEKLILREGSYKEIFPFDEDKTGVRTPTQIKGLELRYLLNMACMWKQDSTLDSILQELEILEVECCNRLIDVVPSPTCFKNLRILKLDTCNALTNLVTYSTAKSLVQLKGMEIKSCKMMTEIVANDEDVPTEDEIVFNYLEWLSIEDFESLTCFCSGNFTFKFPSLEELTLSDCPKMETFSEGFSITTKLKQVKLLSGGEDKGFWDVDLNRTIQQIHKEVVNSKSEELALNGKDIKWTCTGQFPEHQISKVKVLDIMKDESANIPIEILQRFCNLEKLKLKRSSYTEIFSCGNDEEHSGILQRIKVIDLCGLFDLKYMWKQDSQLDWIFQNLEVLEVRYCHNLIPLVPPSTSFENLRTLRIWNCDGLVNLLTSSTAKSMVRLEVMRIARCEMMIEIVANGGDIEKEEIVFTQLKSLKLLCLKSLTNFCSGNCSFKFPALQNLLVYKCPRMKTFSGGVLSTPRLKKVSKYLDSWEWCGQDDLNTTIKQLHKESDCPEL